MKYLGGSQFAIGPLYNPFADDNGTPDWTRNLNEGEPFPNQHSEPHYVVYKSGGSQNSAYMLIKRVENHFHSDAEQAAYFATDRMFRIVSAIVSSQLFQDLVSTAQHVGYKTGKLASDVIKRGEHIDLFEKFTSGIESDRQLNPLTKQLGDALDAYKRSWVAVVESTPTSDVDSSGDQFFDIWQQLEIHAQILADYPLPVAPSIVIKDRIRETQTALNQAIQNWIERSNEALGEMQDDSQSNHSSVTRTRRL